MLEVCQNLKCNISIVSFYKRQSKTLCGVFVVVVIVVVVGGGLVCCFGVF